MTSHGSPQSIATRVVRVTLLSAVAGGALAAVIAMATLDALVTGHGDQRLRGATDTLAGELDEERKEKEEAFEEVLDDENDEIVTSGIRLAVYDGPTLFAGDGWAAVGEPGGCQTTGAFGRRVRSCTRSYGKWLLVAAHSSDREALLLHFVLAGLAALVVGAGTAGLAGRRLTRWAVAPLARLSERLEQTDAEQLSTTPLITNSACREVLAVEKALEQLVKRVSSLLSHAQLFAADAAHELRTPLAALRAELELLQERLDGEAKDTTQSALRRVDLLTRLVERLLLLASPRAELRRAFEPVALDDLLDEVLWEFSEGERQRVIIERLDEGLVFGEPSLLRSLLSNGISNALKFSPEKQAVRVCIEEQEEVAIRIQDEGPGISREQRLRVFEPFYRARPDASEGHGLGLALIGHIAEAHGGQARFADVSHGACLVITLPKWQSAADR